MATIAEYRGPFGKAAGRAAALACRLRRQAGEAEALAKLGFKHAVHALTRPAPYALVGPAPTARQGPAARAGRRRRRRPPLLARPDGADERAADRADDPVWHSWFATSNQGVASQQLMLNQVDFFRGNALGSFADLLHGRHEGPGDADLAERQPERQEPPERELRAAR